MNIVLVLFAFCICVYTACVRLVSVSMSQELAARCRVTNSMVDKTARGSDHFPVVSDLQFIKST